MQPSTSARSRGPGSAQAPPAQALQCTPAAQKLRACHAASLDGNQPPKDEKWWLSEGEEESEDGGGSGGGGCGDGSSDGEGRSGGGDGGALPLREEDPLYDPDADDEDEKWAERQRGGRPTDAILSCPGCFSTVCLECQQHAVLHTRYRAVFTVNCEVVADELMRVPVRPGGPGDGGGNRKRREPDASAGGSDGSDGGGGASGRAAAAREGELEAEAMLPVLCGACGTQVGAQDAEEVVHFYHVLASNP